MRFTALIFLASIIGMNAVAEMPSTEPESAYFFTSCNQIVMVLIRMTDGTDRVFDSQSAESADAVKELASHSKKPARVYEMGCYQIDDRTIV
jgi:hypothetical protein